MLESVMRAWSDRLDQIDQIEGETYIVLVQIDQALGNVQSNGASLLVPGQQASVQGVGVLLDGLVQVTPLHVLQHQHGMLPLQAGPIELDQVAVIRQGPQDCNLLQNNHSMMALEGRGGEGRGGVQGYLRVFSYACNSDHSQGDRLGRDSGDSRFWP